MLSWSRVAQVSQEIHGLFETSPERKRKGDGPERSLSCCVMWSSFTPAARPGLHEISLSSCKLIWFELLKYASRNTEALAQARHGKLRDCEGATARQKQHLEVTDRFHIWQWLLRRMVTDESVAEFISLTSASDDEAVKRLFSPFGSHTLHKSVEAKGYLEMAGGNLQQACCCKGFLSASACGDPSMRVSP